MDVIRKVNLNMTEDFKYKIIKKLVETNGNKRAAALRIGCTIRIVHRMINGYHSKGNEFFIHGNRGRKPILSISNKTRSIIIDLYKTKYHRANFTHYFEPLAINDGIFIIPSTINAILMTEHIISPKACHATKNKV